MESKGDKDRKCDAGHSRRSTLTRWGSGGGGGGCRKAGIEEGIRGAAFFFTMGMRDGKSNNGSFREFQGGAWKGECA